MINWFDGDSRFEKVEIIRFKTSIKEMPKSKIEKSREVEVQ